jgi:hypothetical protein
MQRTAEEFVHELPNGRWFVGDVLRTRPQGHAIFLVELRAGTDAIERVLDGIVDEAGTARLRQRSLRLAR